MSTSPPQSTSRLQACELEPQPKSLFVLSVLHPQTKRLAGPRPLSEHARASDGQKESRTGLDRPASPGISLGAATTRPKSRIQSASCTPVSIGCAPHLKNQSPSVPCGTGSVVSNLGPGPHASPRSSCLRQQRRPCRLREPMAYRHLSSCVYAIPLAEVRNSSAWRLGMRLTPGQTSTASHARRACGGG